MAGELAIVNKLRLNATVYGLTGGATNPRVWLGQRRQGTTTPAITVELDSTDPTDSKDGASGLDNDYVLVFSYADTYEGAYTLANAARTAIDKAVTGVVATVNVQSIQFKDRTYFSDGLDQMTHVVEDRYKVRVIR